MKHLLLTSLCGILLTACIYNGETSLPRGQKSPYAYAFDSLFIDVNAVTASDLHSLMVVQDGRVIYEKYGYGHTKEELHILWSATKTMTALAAGFAWQEELLDIQQPLINYFHDEDLPDTLSNELRGLTLEHLLTMTSGWEADDITNNIRGHVQMDYVDHCLRHPFRDKPGNQWRYNNMDTYMLGIAISHATGKTLDEYLNEKLFTPLGITEYIYETDEQGNNPAAFGLHMTTESLAKIGQFMLQMGKWEGKQLLEARWFEEAMKAQVYQPRADTTLAPTDWQSGYCYQMWHCKKGDIVRMDGQWGQYVIIIPDKNAVVAMTTLCTDRNVQMESFWNHIYPHL